MAGRSKEPGWEVRKKRTTVRWTENEHHRLEEVQKAQGITYLVDVPRIMTLRQLKLEELIGDQAEALENARKMLGLESVEEALWTLARRRLEQIHSELEIGMTE